MDPISKDIKPVVEKTAVEKVVSAAHDLVLFGKVERLTAGICLGIPFLLLIAESDKRAVWWFPLAAACFLALPYGITQLAKAFKIQKKNHGPSTTIFVALLLLVLYYIFTSVWDFKSLRSVSYYVTIKDSYIFGLLLTMGAMLFIANGLIYWDDHQKNTGVAGKRRPVNNFVLGLALLGVVIFPCSSQIWYWPHLFFAFVFFVGCAVATVSRKKGTSKRTQKTLLKHKVADWVPVIIMAGAFLIAIGNYFKWWPGGPFWDLFNIFGAESIGLWVIGVDFILVSLKRLPEL